jgi:Uncharacterised protein family (UPF0236)
MNISSYAQEMMCFVGQMIVFQEASSLINNLTGTNFNAKQIERICHLYGGKLEKKEQEIIESGVSKELTFSEKEAVYYAMIDGAMYPTREKEEPWKEVKLGRIFKADAILQHSKEKNFIEESIYVAHLGEAKDFFPKFEYEIEQLKNIVFINDGGTWIWKWIEETFPESTQILDFYHAKEHLCEFAKDYFLDEKIRFQWIDNQCKTLLEDIPEKVIESIKNLEKQEKTAKKRVQLINYYTKHLNRMRYKTFKDRGLQIGSGAIEAAHKVYQQRFKLSGQHWSKKGLQKTIQLKSAHQSNRWDKVIAIAKAA